MTEHFESLKIEKKLFFRMSLTNCLNQTKDRSRKKL